MTKRNHLEPPKKIDRGGTSLNTYDELFVREELETEGTPGRNTWGRWPSMRIRRLLGLVIDSGWGIWSLGFEERESL